MDLEKLTDPTCLLWGIVPALIGVVAAAASVYCFLRAGTWVHFFLCPISLGSAACGLVILYNVFILGAWPTLLAHFFILVAAGSAIAQVAFLGAHLRHTSVSP